MQVNTESKDEVIGKGHADNFYFTQFYYDFTFIKI